MCISRKNLFIYLYILILCFPSHVFLCVRVLLTVIDHVINYRLVNVGITKVEIALLSKINSIHWKMNTHYDWLRPEKQWAWYPWYPPITNSKGFQGAGPLNRVE